MVDLSKLTPAETARHLGNPEGEIGIAISLEINRTNGNLTSETYCRLASVGRISPCAIRHFGPSATGQADVG
jgi:hypothetical protein